MIESDDASSSGGAGPERGGSFTLLPFQRERFPFRESVLWNPVTPGPVWERARRGCDLVLDRVALDALPERLDRMPEREAAGLLLGRLCECPWTRRPWVHVSRIPVRPVGSGSLGSAVRSMLSEERPAGLLAVGWLRARAAGPLELTAEEAWVHRRHFGEPWNFTFLLVHGVGGPAVGVFAADDGEPLDGRRQRPFYERIAERGDGGPVGARRTAGGEMGGWANYARSPRGAATRARRVGGVIATRRARDPLRWAAVVVGIGAGLALSAELAPGVGPAAWTAGPMAFGAPRAAPAPMGGSSAGRDTGRHPAPQNPARPDPAPPVGFDERLAAFERAAEAYLRLGGRAGPGRRGCERLAPAHRAVGEEFALLRGAVQEAPGPIVLAQLREAASVKQDIDGRFADQGCPAAGGRP